MNHIYDVAIIGAGVIGCGIARELSCYELKVAVVEKEPDVGWGTSKANSGVIHAGYDATPGTLKASFSAPGNKLYDKWADELSLDFQRIGSFVSAKDKTRRNKLEELRDQGLENGVEGLEIIDDPEVIHDMEPNLSPEVKMALHAPTAGIVAPYKLVIALYENAKKNGVDFYFDFPVESIDSLTNSEKDHSFSVQSDTDKVNARFVVSAAGVHSGKIANMVSDYSFEIFPARGEYYLLDKEISGYVNKINFPLPSAESKGILVTPAVEGSIIFGPNHEKLESASIATTSDGLQEVLDGAMDLFPEIDTGKIITNFAGLRAKAGSNDFVIGESDSAKGFINVGGIQSPGLTSAPAISHYVIDLLSEKGLDLVDDSDFDPYREPIPRFGELSLEEVSEYIDDLDAAREIVCRCEEVTRAEIEEAIDRGANTLDGIKFRTRSRMGDCQGGFCTPRLIEILSDKLGISPREVTKKGNGSYLLSGKTKKVE